MEKILRTITLATFVWTALAGSGLANAKIECSGRLYPAKAVAVGFDFALLDIDLGFGINYRARIRMAQTAEPKHPGLSWGAWTDKSKTALEAKIDGKAITICVYGNNEPLADFYVEGENLNKWMIAQGHLAFEPFRRTIFNRSY